MTGVKEMVLELTEQPEALELGTPLPPRRIG
jgi:hypothetical protein